MTIAAIPRQSHSTNVSRHTAFHAGLNSWKDKAAQLATENRPVPDTDSITILKRYCWEQRWIKAGGDLNEISNLAIDQLKPKVAHQEKCKRPTSQTNPSPRRQREHTFTVIKRDSNGGNKFIVPFPPHGFFAPAYQIRNRAMQEEIEIYRTELERRYEAFHEDIPHAASWIAPYIHAAIIAFQPTRGIIWEDSQAFQAIASKFSRDLGRHGPTLLFQGLDEAIELGILERVPAKVRFGPQGWQLTNAVKQRFKRRPTQVHPAAA